MHRRSVLRLLLGAIGSAWAFVACVPRRRSVPEADVERNAPETPEQLKEDWARLEQRNYAEQGIPMFLMCENLSPTAEPGSTSERNFRDGRILAAALRNTAEIFQHIHPSPKASDVPRLIEALAERDFGTGFASRTEGR